MDELKRDAAIAAAEEAERAQKEDGEESAPEGNATECDKNGCAREARVSEPSLEALGEVEDRLTLPEVAEGKAKTKKDKKKKWISTLILVAFNVIAIAVVLWLELKDDAQAFVGIDDLGKQIGGNYYWLLIALGAYAAHTLSDAFVYFTLIRQCGYGNRFGLALRVAILGKYYDNLTPWATGGQPFQMVYMAKASLDTPTACTLPFVKHTIRIFTLDAFVITLFAIYSDEISWVIKLGAALAIVFTSLLPVVVMVFSKKLNFTFKLTEKVVKLGVKMRLVKDYDKAVGKARDTVDSLAAAYKYLSYHKSTIVILAILSLIDLVAVGSYPYLIVRALGGEGSFWEIMSRSYFVTLSSGIIPTPGASGASEGAFYSVFDGATPAGTLFWAVILYRVLVFYLPIFVGLASQLIEGIMGRSHVKLVGKEVSWLKKKTIKNNDAE